MTAVRNEMVDMLYNTGRLVLPFNQTLGVYASPDADPSAFPSQVQQVARERRDAEIDTLAAKYEKLLDQLDNKLRREEQELSADRRELADMKREELFTKGEALLSLLRGRTTYTLSRSSRATRYRNQSKSSVTESEQMIVELENKMQETQQKFEQEIAAVNDKWAKIAATSQDYVITPYKKDIQVELFGIGWIPYYYAEVNGQALLLPGY
jgi:ribonucleotide monophosphatase NagD (HAD superfamily)